MTPLWLDPTPAVRQFIGGFANAPVREPFAGMRKKMLTGLSWEDSKTVGGLRGGEATKAKAQADADYRGETMRERLKRQRKEHYAKNRDYYANRYQAQKAEKLAMPKQ